MDSGTAALLGALIGATSGIAGGVVLEDYKRRRDRKGTASAIAGEIASILHMTERRRHVEAFNGFLTLLDAGTDVAVPKLAPPGDYRDPVVDRYLDKIGLLPKDLPERIVRFYTYLAGVRVDLERMTAGEFDVPTKAYIIREDLALWQETTVLGNELVIELRRLERPGWRRGKPL